MDIRIFSELTHGESTVQLGLKVIVSRSVEIGYVLKQEQINTQISVA